jgi:hypothetical protein
VYLGYPTQNQILQFFSRFGIKFRLFKTLAYSEYKFDKYFTPSC